MEPNLDRIEKKFIWNAHPAKERIAAAVGASVVILFITIIVFISFNSLSWSIFSAITLVLALNRFYFPSRFAIDEKGITAYYPLKRQHYSWLMIRQFLHDRYGGYLSTKRRVSRIKAHRGMHILFGQDRNVVIRQINKRLHSVEHR